MIRCASRHSTNILARHRLMLLPSSPSNFWVDAYVFLSRLRLFFHAFGCFSFFMSMHILHSFARACADLLHYHPVAVPRRV
jgi:hypothetical protein